MGEQFRRRALFGCSGGIFTTEVGPTGGLFVLFSCVYVCACLRACVRVCVCAGGGWGLLVFNVFLLRIWAPQGAAIVVRSLPVKSRKGGIVTYLVIWPHVTFRPCS